MKSMSVHDSKIEILFDEYPWPNNLGVFWSEELYEIIVYDSFFIDVRDSYGKCDGRANCIRKKRVKDSSLYKRKGETKFYEIYDFTTEREFICKYCMESIIGEENLENVDTQLKILES